MGLGPGGVFTGTQQPSTLIDLWESGDEKMVSHQSQTEGGILWQRRHQSLSEPGWKGAAGGRVDNVRDCWADGESIVHRRVDGPMGGEGSEMAAYRTSSQRTGS